MSNWLFVCYGNICRSPIAENLARRLFPEETLVDSAGTHSWAADAATETIAVMRALYDIDISGHRPKKLDDVPLHLFDHIVALSSTVAEDIRFHFPQAREKLMLWEIADPYQDGRDAFERCARHIEKLLRESVSEKV